MRPLILSYQISNICLIAFVEELLGGEVCITFRAKQFMFLFERGWLHNGIKRFLEKDV